MLVPEELDMIHSPGEYAAFIRTATGDPEGLLKVCRGFDDWMPKNREQLDELHEKSKTSAEFMPWARECYYLWLYNQEKKMLNDEIDKLTDTA